MDFTGSKVVKLSGISQWKGKDWKNVGKISLCSRAAVFLFSHVVNYIFSLRFVLWLVQQTTKRHHNAKEREWHSHRYMSALGVLGCVLVVEGDGNGGWAKMFCQGEEYFFSGFGRKHCRDPDQTSSAVPRVECVSWREGHRRGETHSRMLLSGRGEPPAPDPPLWMVLCQQPPSPLSSTVQLIVPVQLQWLFATWQNHKHTVTEHRAKGVVVSQCVLFFMVHDMRIDYVPLINIYLGWLNLCRVKKIWINIEAT